MKRPGVNKRKAGKVVVTEGESDIVEILSQANALLTGAAPPEPETSQARPPPGAEELVLLGDQGPVPVVRHPPANVPRHLWEADCRAEWNRSERRPLWMQCAGDTLGQHRCLEYQGGMPFKSGWYHDSEIPEAVKEWLKEYASGARKAWYWADGAEVPAEDFDPRRVRTAENINTLLTRTDLYCKDRVEPDAPAPDPVSRTGAPGRPPFTSMHLVEAEHARRVAAHEAVQGVAAEAKQLRTWLKSAHPESPLPSARTIENKIRKPHRVAGLIGAPAPRN